METIIKPAMTVLSHTVKTNMKDLEKHLNIPEELYREAVESGMRVTGCNYWIYSDYSEDMSSDFTLEMVLPVMTKGKKNKKFQLKKLPPYKCVTHLHHGSWTEFKDVYPEFMQRIMSSGMKIGKSNREMYINCDFEKQDNCITEIQFEII
jgi:effector-binding domain-containing protein